MLDGSLQSWKKRESPLQVPEENATCSHSSHHWSAHGTFQRLLGIMSYEPLLDAYGLRSGKNSSVIKTHPTLRRSVPFSSLNHVSGYNLFVKLFATGYFLSWWRVPRLHMKQSVMFLADFKLVMISSNFMSEGKMINSDIALVVSREG